MNRIFTILALLIMLGFVSGCTTVIEKVTEEQVENAIEANAAAHGENVDVEIDVDNKEMTIETDEGTVNVKSDMKNTDEWCATGSNWDYSATTDAGNANAEWKIVGLINSGEYDGLCHVKYTATGPEGDVIMDYYFSEDGESGYFEMNVGGQVIKQEWSN